MHTVAFHRRHPPHLYIIGKPVFITWRLHGSLPSNRSFGDDSMTSGEALAALDRLLDEASSGPVYLRQFAGIVVDALHHGATVLKHYELHAYAVMPNHVHLLITPLVPLPKITKSLKGITAKRANEALHRDAVLAGRELRSPRPQPRRVQPHPPLHRAQPRARRLGRTIQMGDRGVARGRGRPPYVLESRNRGMERAGKLLRKSGLLAPEEVVRAAWRQTVGKTIARNTRVVAVRGTRIVVEVPDALFQDNLRAFVPAILTKLSKVAGPGMVESITVNVGVPRIEPRRAAKRDEADAIEDATLRRVYRDSRDRLTS